jgi:hypothetical protein
MAALLEQEGVGQVQPLQAAAMARLPAIHCQLSWLHHLP